MGQDVAYIEDKELGLIRVRPNRRARRFIFRADKDGLVVTCPSAASAQGIREAIERLRPKLSELLGRAAEKVRSNRLAPGVPFGSDLFTLTWEQAKVGGVSARIGRGSLTILYPEGTQWDEASLQKWLVAQAERALTLLAKSVLPQRLAELARERGFSFTSVTVRKTHSRWGSCGTKGNISLSIYLALLPAHLRDYVMLHELCHTHEMNHSPKFHALLDEATGGNDKLYDREMRGFVTSLFFRR